MKLSEWLAWRIEQDILWATEASRSEKAFAEDGVHWQWVNPETDQPLVLNPMVSKFIGGNEDVFRVSLRSVEEWPAEHVEGTLPQFSLYGVEEVPVSVGGHIVRHDPARVLADLRGRLKTIRRCVEAQGSGSLAKRAFANDVLRDMAEAYPDQPDNLHD